MLNGTFNEIEKKYSALSQTLAPYEIERDMKSRLDFEIIKLERKLEKAKELRDLFVSHPEISLVLDLLKDVNLF